MELVDSGVNVEFVKLVDSRANVELVKLVDCRANVAEPWEFAWNWLIVERMWNWLIVERMLLNHGNSRGIG